MSHYYTCITVQLPCNNWIELIVIFYLQVVDGLDLAQLYLENALNCLGQTFMKNKKVKTDLIQFWL